jgi:hypothetical protein
MKMEKKSKMKLLFVSLVMTGFTCGFTSCGDDDKDKVLEPTLDEVKGNFGGTMTIGMTTYDAAGEAVNVEVRVDADSLYFDNFPAEGLIGFIVQDEERAAMIKQLLQVRPVKYTMKYAGAFDAAKKNIAMIFTAKPLEIVIPISEEEVQAIKVSLTIAEEGAYTLEGKKLKFGIKATGVDVNGAALPGFTEIGFNFDMTKK